MANSHLVILKKPYIDMILAGEKVVESRFFRIRKPFIGQIQKGDRLYLKVSSGPVCAEAKVCDVKVFDGLSPGKIAAIRQRYNHLICGEEDFWRSRMDCRSGFLVWLADVRRIEPVWIDKRDMRAWVLLPKGQSLRAKVK